MNELFNENILGDALNKAGGAMGMDMTAMRNAVNDKDATVTDVLRAANDHGVAKAADLATTVARAVDSGPDRTSIIARAKDSVLQFPVYMTQSIRINEAHVIAQSLERVYANLVQTVLAANPTINHDEVNNLRFLKQFHTNIREAADALVNKYYSPIDDFDAMMQESISQTIVINEKVTVKFTVTPTTDKNLIAECARLSHDFLDGFPYLQEAPLERDEPVTQRNTDETSTPAQQKELTPQDFIQLADQLNAYNANKNKSIEDPANHFPTNYTAADIPKEIRGGMKMIWEELPVQMEPIRDKDGKVLDYRFFITKPGTKSVTTVDTKTGSVVDPVDVPQLLRDHDARKINAMMPWTFKASFHVKDAEGKYQNTVNFLIGVKANVHIIYMKDLVNDLRGLITGNIKTLQKVRYKTGEIGFKDYMFNVNDLRRQAASTIDPGKRWVQTLRQLGEYDKLHGTLLKKGIQAITDGHIPVPNGTMVLAQGDVSILANQTGIDISLASNAIKLIRALFLIAVIIVDETAGKMHILRPDESADWNVQSLASLDAELAKADTSAIQKEIQKGMYARS